MCNPAAAMIGVSALQGGMNIMGQQQNQKMQIQYQQQLATARNNQILQNRSMATDAYLSSINGENVMKAQEDQALAENSRDVGIQALKAQSTAKVNAADAGVGGGSLDSLLLDFKRQESMMLGRLDLNQQFSDQARTQRSTGYAQTFRNRLTQVQPFQPSAVAAVDYLSPILGIAGAGLQAGNATGFFTKPKTAPPAASSGSALYSEGE